MLSCLAVSGGFDESSSRFFRFLGNNHLPATATEDGWNENIRRHNYVFNNGVGHFLQEIVRFQPYVFYSNLPLE